MFIPEDIWKIIKNYTFDYIQIWKKIFTKNILSDKILNTKREFDCNINGYFTIATVTAIWSLPLTQHQKYMYAYEGETHSNIYIRGWIKFTKDKKELSLQQKWLNRQTELNEYNKEIEKLSWECDEDFSPEQILENEYYVDTNWGLFDTDDY